MSSGNFAVERRASYLLTRFGRMGRFFPTAYCLFSSLLIHFYYLGRLYFLEVLTFFLFSRVQVGFSLRQASCFLPFRIVSIGLGRFYSTPGLVFFILFLYLECFR